MHFFSVSLGVDVLGFRFVAPAHLCSSGFTLCVQTPEFLFEFFKEKLLAEVVHVSIKNCNSAIIISVYLAQILSL